MQLRSKTVRALGVLASLSCVSQVRGQNTIPNNDASSIVVNAGVDVQKKQDQALADAVEAYQKLSAKWTMMVRCDLRQLCADEQFVVRVAGAYVQLIYSPPSEPAFKMASFPLDFVQTVNGSNGVLPPEGTPAYSYIKLQRSLSVISRQAAAERQLLYRFPDPQDNPFLPWPPHPPSSFEDISPAFRTKTSLGEIAKQIRDRIAFRGYNTLRYFSVPGGFAMATDVERVGRARPVSDADRWTSGKRGGFVSLMDYWRRLLAGENDRFRVFVFIVTDADIQNDQEDATADDLRRWKVTGRPSLSRERAAATALPGTRIWLYAYEFNASRSKGAELIQNERDPLRIQENKTALGLP